MIIGFLRTVILYLLLLTGMRLLGKRQIGQLEPAELVLTLLISDLASVPMQDFGIPLLNGVIPIVTLLCLSSLLSLISAKSIRFRTLTCGRPSILVENGRIVQKEMRQNRMTADELYEELRQNGYTDLSKLKYVILEDSGEVSILPYAAEKPLSAGQANVKTEDGGLPLIVVSDGRVIGAALHRRNLDEAWLLKTLGSYGARDYKDVFLLTVDELGRTYYVPKEREG